MSCSNVPLIIFIICSFLTLVAAQTPPPFRTFTADNISFEYPPDWHVNDKSTDQLYQFNLVPDKGNVLIMVMVYRRDISTWNEFNQLLKTESRTRLEKIKKGFSKSILSEACLKTKEGPVPGHRIDGVYRGNKSSAESYSHALNGKFLNLVYIKEDSESTTADPVWNKLRATFKINDMYVDYGFNSVDPTSLAVLNGKARKLPKPKSYPLVPRHGDSIGKVTVEVRIVIDKDGNVIEAKAVSGLSAFHKGAVDAAKLAKFSPTYICGELQQKVTGILVYIFR